MGNIQKIYFIFVALFCSLTLANAQKKVTAKGEPVHRIPPKMQIDGGYEIAPGDKRIADLLIKGRKFTIYSGYRSEGSLKWQGETDTTIVYKITLYKQTVVQKEIVKCAVRDDGKLMQESTYKMQGGKLVIVQKSYAYEGARITTFSYTSDEDGLSLESERSKEIDQATLSDQYIKEDWKKVPVELAPAQ